MGGFIPLLANSWRKKAKSERVARLAPCARSVRAREPEWRLSRAAKDVEEGGQ